MKSDTPSSRRPPPPRTWVPYTVLAAMLLVTALAAHYVYSASEVEARLRFENAALRAGDDINDRLDTYVAMLRAGAGLFAARGEVSRAEFRAFVERLELQTTYPGIRGVGFSQRVTPDEVGPLVERVRREGFDDFTIRQQPSAEGGELHSIIYLEPLDARNRAALGFDMFSEPVRREAMERARDTGAPAATGRVKLIQELNPGDEQAGFLLYVPVYRGGPAPATLEERRAALRGFIYSPFRAGDLLRGIFGEGQNHGVDFSVYDGARTDAEENLLHRSGAAAGGGGTRARFTTDRTLDVAGRTWSILFTASPAADFSSGSRLVPYIVAGGLFLSLVLFLVTRSQARARRATEEAAADLRASESRFRTVIEQSPLSTQIFSPDGKTLRVNRAWEQLWGATLEALDGYNILRDPQLEERGIAEYIRRGFAGEAVAVPAILYDPEQTLPGATRHKDARRWVSAVIYPVKDDEGRVREVVLMHQDITERTRAEEEVRESEERFRTLAETASDGIINIDETSTILFINHGAEKIFGHAVADMLGHSLTMLMPDYLRHVHRAGLANFLETGRRHVAWDRVELPGLHKDGHEIPLELSFGEFVREGRHYFTGVVRDITDRRRVEREREQMLERERALRAEAEEANRFKDEFLATLSHELRTPLTSVLGWSKLLRTEELSPAVTARALEAIERNASAQTHLINDLLDVSRIVTGKLRLSVVPLALAPVIEAAVEGVRPAAQARGVNLNLRLDPSTGYVSGDADRLQQVVWNFLSNAIKFTPRGGSVEVCLARAEGHAEVSVADTGRGIPPEFLPHVFERFRQADGAITREHGGLGLGLAIARHLVELHGGSVTAESQGPGLGATFRFRLPLL